MRPKRRLPPLTTRRHQVPEIRQHHKHVWAQVLLSLEEEYRQPRLQTLQLALIVISSRPPVNTGQNTIAMARVLGAAQLLGLHIDPSSWRLPQWERSLRKRIWWSLVVHDKFRALLYGRPSKYESFLIARIKLSLTHQC